jgi:hypothetical protein
MPRYQVTVRHGRRTKRYHVVQLEASDMADALRRAGASLPDGVRDEADLAEVRPAPEPEAERPYLGEGDA